MSLDIMLEDWKNFFSPEGWVLLGKESDVIQIAKKARFKGKIKKYGKFSIYSSGNKVFLYTLLCVDNQI